MVAGCRHDSGSTSGYDSSTAEDLGSIEGADEQAKLQAAASLESWEQAEQLQHDIRRSSFAPPQARVTGLERQLTLLVVSTSAVAIAGFHQNCAVSCSLADAPA